MDAHRSDGGDVTLANLPLAEVRRRQRRIQAQIRDVEHWRRLVAARLDLAVAAVADIDDLRDIRTVESGAPLPRRAAPADGEAAADRVDAGDRVDVADRLSERSLLPLRDLLGIPRSEGRLPESALLLQLRDALRELDTYTGTLRSDAAATARALVERIGADSTAEAG